MDDSEVIARAIAELSALFPKRCSSCGVVYSTFRDWSENVRPLDGTISYDAETGTWGEGDLIGAAVLANCTCGTTLSLSTDALHEDTHRAMLKWLKRKVEASGKSPSEVLDDLRTQVREALRTTNA